MFLNKSKYANAQIFGTNTDKYIGQIELSCSRMALVQCIYKEEYIIHQVKKNNVQIFKYIEQIQTNV